MRMIDCFGYSKDEATKAALDLLCVYRRSEHMRTVLNKIFDRVIDLKPCRETLAALQRTPHGPVLVTALSDALQTINVLDPATIAALTATCNFFTPDDVSDKSPSIFLIKLLESGAAWSIIAHTLFFIEQKSIHDFPPIEGVSMLEYVSAFVLRFENDHPVRSMLEWDFNPNVCDRPYVKRKLSDVEGDDGH